MIFNLNKFNKEIKALGLLKSEPNLLEAADKQRIKQNILRAISSPAPAAEFSPLRNKLASAIKYLVPALLGLSLVGGTAFAANNSKPGDVLYPVKIASEKAQLKITVSEQAKAQLQAKFALERLNELKKLSDENQGAADNSDNFDGNPGLNLYFSGSTTVEAGTTTLASSTEQGHVLKFENHGRVNFSTSSSGSGRRQNLEIQAKHEAELEVTNAIDALNKVQLKLNDKGDSKAAQAIGQNIINLQNNASQSLRLNFNRGRKSDGGSVQGDFTNSTNLNTSSNGQGNSRFRSASDNSPEKESDGPVASPNFLNLDLKNDTQTQLKLNSGHN